MDLTNLPNPYPLPYGEYLGEVEAVHLILAHDLYNELREIVGAVQELGSARDDAFRNGAEPHRPMGQKLVSDSDPRSELTPAPVCIIQ